MNLFKKIFNTSNIVPSIEKKSIHNEPKALDIESIEELFTTNFIKNGGKFLFCENLSEIKEQFLNILVENDWFECDVLCNEEQLFSMLEDNKLNYLVAQNPTFLFSTCESLIAEDGAILLSSKQINQYKQIDLPFNIIIFATTSQIVNTKSDGLKRIQNNYQNEYPTNITTIKYFDKAKEEYFLHYGSTAKNIYLLLLEN